MDDYARFVLKRAETPEPPLPSQAEVETDQPDRAAAMAAQLAAKKAAKKRRRRGY
jgi:hypothetical protein